MKILSLFCRTNSFQDQLEQIRPRLYRLAYSWSHNAALADDLVQETLIKALKNASQLRDPALLHSWLFSILANCWRDHFRKHREMDDIEELEDYRYAHEITPEAEHSQSQIVSRVRVAVAKLPAGQPSRLATTCTGTPIRPHQKPDAGTPDTFHHPACSSTAYQTAWRRAGRCSESSS